MRPIGIHHIGISVASLETALAFWEKFLGRPARWTRILDRPYLSRVVGYPDVSIKAAFVDLPGGVIIELLDYQTSRIASPTPRRPPTRATFIFASPSRTRERRGDTRVACGARAVSRDGPVDIDGGPNVGAKAALSENPRRRHAGAVPTAPKGGASLMIKRVSLLRRKEGMSREEFFAHWTGPMPTS